MIPERLSRYLVCVGLCLGLALPAHAVTIPSVSAAKSADTVAEGMDFQKGATQGDFAEGDIGWGGMLGQVGIGIIPFVGQAADARDTVAGVRNIWNDPRSGAAWAGLGGAVVGWVPVVGNAAKGAIRAGRQTAKEVAQAAARSADEVVGATTRATGGGARTFRHYGYAEDAAKFEGGLRPGGYATHSRGRPMHGRTAQERLALPHEVPPDAYYKVRVGPDTPVVGPGHVSPTTIPPRGGGGIEYTFPRGTPPGSVEGPFRIP